MFMTTNGIKLAFMNEIAITSESEERRKMATVLETSETGLVIPSHLIPDLWTAVGQVFMYYRR